MKKEVVVFGLVAVASVAFVLMQSTGDKKGGGEKAAVTAAGDSDILPVGKSYAKGPATAPVTIVEFSDFQCPFCTRVNPTLKQVQDTYGDKVRIVFKHNPLPFHQKAPLASEATLAAGEQGKFWEMHDKLFANQQKIDRPDLEQYATELGLDLAKFKAALDSKKFKAEVDADLALGTKVGARGTPNFFINGVQLTGARPFDQFKTEIDNQLKAAEELTKAGTKADQVYAALVKKNFKAPSAQANKGGAPEDDKTVYKVPVGDSYWKGEKDAQVTIVEFSDYQCPFCTRAEATVKQALEAYPGKVKVVFKHNPLAFHADAPLASQAALAAGAQGKFWEMHEKLFANQKEIKREHLDKYAGEIGLDVAKFKGDLDSGAFKKAVDADLATGTQFGVQGTPNFFINGRKIVGAQPFENFKKLIDEEITKTDALLKAGTAKGDLYAKITENGKTKADAPAPREQGNAPDDKTVYKVPVEKDDAIKGPADALVTIVEFSEFQCPFCSRVLPTTKQIVDTYGKDVRIVFKHAPLPFHADAPLASEAALAAGAQGKFWEMHDKLFASQKELKRESLEKFAQEIGLNLGKFKADLDAGTFKKQIERDKALAAQIGAGGTPNFYINGRNLVGAQPFDAFKKVIDEEIKKAGDLVAKGTARSAVYAELTKNGATSKVAGAPGAAPAEDTKIYDVKIETTDAVKGNAKAPITIVEFSEFQCPFCARVGPTMKQIEETYGSKVRFVFKHNPLPFHADAPLASQAALAAHEQGKFWQMHDALFANQKDLKRESLEKYAQELGLNMTKFKAALDANKFKDQIDANMAQAKELQANGTPHFFVNGRRVKGAQPFESFKKVIDEELAKKGVK
jgi:protein-disulfide isomerase